MDTGAGPSSDGPDVARPGDTSPGCASPEPPRRPRALSTTVQGSTRRARRGKVQPEPDTPGWRLRNLRVRLDLTQADLGTQAGLSESYVSMLESGRRRLEGATADRLAHALGTSAAYLTCLVDGTEVVDYLDAVEAKITDGRFGEAWELLDYIDPGAVAHDERWRLLMLHGRVREDTPGRALRFLSEAVEAAHRYASGREVARAATTLLWAHLDSGDSAAAIRDGHTWLAVVDADEGAAGSDERHRFAATVMWTHFERGDRLYAAHMGLGLVDATRDQPGTMARGTAAWNTALVMHALGEIDRAEELTRMALSDLEVVGDPADLARLRTDVAHISVRAAPPRYEVALDLLEQAEEPMRRYATLGEVHLWSLLRARVAYQMGDLDTARSHAEAVRPGGAHHVEAAATAHVILGDVAFTTGRADAAAEHYLTAENLALQSPVPRRVAELWADLFARFGALDRVCDAIRVAARVDTSPVPAPHAPQGHTGQVHRR